jgi:hydrogenase maturation protease
MGDDGAGQLISYLLDLNLKGTNVKVINGNIVPEQRLDEIIQFAPQSLLMIDAIQTEDPPGTIMLLDENRMRMYLPVSSHNMPLPIFVDRIKTNVPGIQIKLLGIRPFSLEFSERYALFEEDKHTLDDYELNPNLPFYAFHLTSEMEKLCHQLATEVSNLVKKYYFH